MTDTEVILVTPDQFDVLRTALLNLRTANHDYVVAERKKSKAKLPAELERVYIAEKRITAIDELLERLALRRSKK